jgi:restriction endonuclease S subunit
MIVKIGEVCEVIAGQSPEGSSYNKVHNGIEFHQGKKLFGDQYILESNIYTSEPTKIAEPGDILISVRAPVGPINITNRRICIGRGLAAIRPSDKIDLEYLFYYLRMNEDNINGREGATFSSINKSDIENMEFALPSIENQKAMVKYLNKTLGYVDQSIGLTLKKIAELKDLKRSILGTVFLPDEKDA